MGSAAATHTKRSVHSQSDIAHCYMLHTLLSNNNLSQNMIHLSSFFWCSACFAGSSQKASGLPRTLSKNVPFQGQGQCRTNKSWEINAPPWQLTATSAVERRVPGDNLGRQSPNIYTTLPIPSFTWFTTASSTFINHIKNDVRRKLCRICWLWWLNFL